VNVLPRLLGYLCCVVSVLPRSLGYLCGVISLFFLIDIQYLFYRFLILEHVSGGELFDYLVRRGRLPIVEVFH
jgi:hypothetical protein